MLWFIINMISHRPTSAKSVDPDQANSVLPSFATDSRFLGIAGTEAQLCLLYTVRSLYCDQLLTQKMYYSYRWSLKADCK